jgi:hypothetical protein
MCGVFQRVDCCVVHVLSVQLRRPRSLHLSIQMLTGMGWELSYPGVLPLSKFICWVGASNVVNPACIL